MVFKAISTTEFYVTLIHWTFVSEIRFHFGQCGRFGDEPRAAPGLCASQEFPILVRGLEPNLGA